MHMLYIRICKPADNILRKFFAVLLKSGNQILTGFVSCLNTLYLTCFITGARQTVLTASRHIFTLSEVSGTVISYMGRD